MYELKPCPFCGTVPRMGVTEPTFGEPHLMRRCVVSTLFGELSDAAVFNLCMFSFVLPWEVIAGTVITYGLAKVLYEVVMYPITQCVIKKVKSLPEM